MSPLQWYFEQSKWRCYAKVMLLGRWPTNLPLRVHETINVYYYRVIFMVKHSQMNGLFHFHYFIPQQGLFKSLSSDRNEDHMKTLLPLEVHIPIYHF